MDKILFISVMTLVLSANVGNAQEEKTDSLAGHLKEVEVVAQRKTIKNDVDKIIYDVSNDKESATKTIIEILKKVPSVTVDSENNVLLNGSDDFMIYKNGKPNGVLSSKEVLATIPASQVKCVEVITTPGARYDAEGVNGILNIVMKKYAIIDGVAGNIRGWVEDNGSYSSNIYAMTQLGKLSLEASYGYGNYSGEYMKKWSLTEYDYRKNGYRLYAYDDSNMKGKSHMVNVSGSYDIDSLNLITVSFDAVFNRFKNGGAGFTVFAYPNNGGNYSYKDKYTYLPYNPYSCVGRVDYQHLTRKDGEVVSLSYLVQVGGDDNEVSRKYENVENAPIDYVYRRFNKKEDFREHTLQIDYMLPIGKTATLNTGAKYIYRYNNSTSVDSYDNGKRTETDFTYNSHIGALYGELGVDVKNVKVKAGARYELCKMRGVYKDGSNPDFSKRLGDFVPSFGLKYDIGKTHSVGVNYNVRIARPRIGYINPSIIETPESVSFGNPNIESAKHHNITVNYMMLLPRFILRTSLSHKQSNDLFTAYDYVQDGKRYNTYTSSGKYRSLEIMSYMRCSPFHKTCWSFTLQAINRKVENRNMDVSLKRWIVYAFSQIEQRLPWGIVFAASVGRNGGGFETPYSYKDATYWCSFDLSRGFMRDNRLQVSLTASNPFLSSHYSPTSINVVNGDYVGCSEDWRLKKSFMLTVSYRFGNQKSRVKSTMKTIENTDLEK